MTLTSHEIRQRFLDFFEKRGHAVISSASLVATEEKGATDNTLFNTAGMQPLIPYLLGEEHPKGKRLVNSQKCVRTIDLEEVGDNTHFTFFEMLGNWSLGDYFKKEAIEWSYTFLIDPDEGLGLDPERLYVTVFAGNDDVPRDMEAVDIWKQFVPEHRIYFRDSKDNWWTAGADSPAGPSTEMFYDVIGELGDMTPEEFEQADEEQKVVEIWNDVFMVYEQKEGKVVGELPQKNVDTGAGLERVTAGVQGVTNIYDTDIFAESITAIRASATKQDQKAERIVADHVRTAVFLLADGVEPSNTGRGYVLRRIIRRAVKFAGGLGLEPGTLLLLADIVIQHYKKSYPHVFEHAQEIKNNLSAEETVFRSTLEKGLKQFEKVATGDISGHDAFVLFTTYGFPFEMTQELADERGLSVDAKEFNKELEKHQELSRTGAAGKFKGGLADDDPQTVKYHTATHLLQQALRDVLGEHVTQKGSNINAKRLRFDFTHDEKLTEKQKQQVEALVNEQISASLPVSYEEVSLEEAKEQGALGVFDDKYEDKVKIYTMGDYSLEICGGPHVENTSELGTFTIKKEQSVAKGVRRIKAILS